MLQNPTQNGSPKKHRTNTPGGDQKIIPKCLKIVDFRVRKHQLARKKPCFATVVFSCFFWCYFFGIFGPFWVHFGGQDPKDGGLFFATFLLFFVFSFGFDFLCDFGQFFLPEATRNMKKAMKKQVLPPPSPPVPHHQRHTTSG